MSHNINTKCQYFKKNFFVTDGVTFKLTGEKRKKNIKKERRRKRRNDKKV